MRIQKGDSRLPVKDVIRRHINQQTTHLFRQVYQHLDEIGIQPFGPLRILFRDIGPPFRRAMNDGPDVFLIAEECAGSIEIEEVEFLICRYG